MTDHAVDYEFHSGSKRSRLILSVLCAAACVWVGFHARGATMVCISAAFALGAVAAQVEQHIRIDPASREVYRRLSLWGRSLRSLRHSLDDFTGVAAYRLPAGTPQAPADLVHVGLRRVAGSVLAVRYFPVRRGQPCPEAEAFARGLEATTRLGFHGLV